MKPAWYSLILLFSTLFCTHLFLGESQVYNVLVENSAFEIDLENSYCKGKIEGFDIEVCRNMLKKPHYIWLFLDAFAAFQSGDLASYVNNSAYYNVKFSGYPQSATIHAEQVTGKVSRNLVGAKLLSETAIDQMKGKLNYYVGNNFPLINLLGEERFAKVYQFNVREQYPFKTLERASGMFGSSFIRPDLTKNGEIKGTSNANKFVIENSEELLENGNIKSIESLLKSFLAYDDINLVYYSTIMDSYNHNYAAFSIKTLSVASALLGDIKAIIQILEKTEMGDKYVLFVSSDHGGQWDFGEDEVCNHGCNMDKGNEGFLYIYNKGSIGNFRGEIKHEDIGPIVSQYINNAGLPSRAGGFPKKISEGEKFELMNFRAKEIQLLNYLNYLDGGNRNLKLMMGRKYDFAIKDKEIVASLNEEYPEYLKNLQRQAENLETSKEAYVLLILSFVAIIYWIYCISIEIQINVILLFIEHVFILFFGGLTGRVERTLFWPLVLFHILNFISSFVKVKSDLLSFSPYSTYKSILAYIYSLGKGRVFTIHDIKPITSLLNILLLLSSHYDYFVIKDYTLYWFHYSALQFLYLYDIKSIKGIWHYILLIFGEFSIALMIIYEQITDYSMTDQTPNMITTIRIFYVSLIFFVIFSLILAPREFKAKFATYPVIIVYFFIASQSQRLHYTLFFLPIIYIYSKLDSIYLILIQAITSYLITLGTFGFDISLRAGNHSWGVGPDIYPIFTGVIFGIHKLAWYIIAGCFMMVSSKEFTRNFKILTLKAILAVWIFCLGFYLWPSSTISLFIWANSQCMTLLLSHTVGLLALNTSTNTVNI
ncbi:unnamed protein product [Blepharisma stoltei]|uniref:Sulfatase N-terminal domain-containing protein n=1 Tax=Blepharisma stoltei TaxID=1481888 RepID=A0AAU9K5N5_9CILI|nr:unnamed protein product [Blepharisma stoltei]